MTRLLTMTIFNLGFNGLLISAAQAHPAAGGVAGFDYGFGHPFSGLDHVLVMVAVGLLAARLGGRAAWMVPGAFLTMMAAGAVMGAFGIPLPFAETGIALSVIVIGALVATQAAPAPVIAISLASFFAIFHGHVHGAEMPVDTAGLSDGLGFMMATASLHAAGIALGFGAARLATDISHRAVRLGGGAMALAGVGILSGYLS